MTIVEHLKSDLDAILLIVISVGAAVVCVAVLWLVVLRCSRKVQGKRKQLQRPFVTSKTLSPSPRNASPTLRYSPLNQWTRGKWSPSSPENNLSWVTPSPTKSGNYVVRNSSPNNQRDVNRSISPRFLGQVISCINKTDPRTSSLGISSVHRISPGKDYSSPFLLDQSLTDDQDSTLPSLLLSSDSSTDCITERSLGEDGYVDKRQQTPTTVDKGVNTENEVKENTMTSSKVFIKEQRRNRFAVSYQGKDNFISQLWSHKCHLPCHGEVDLSMAHSRTLSFDSCSSSGDLHTDPENKSTHKDRNAHYKSNEGQTQDHSTRFSRAKPGTRKCATDVCVQTELSGEIHRAPDHKQDNSPLCSPGSTVKDNDTAVNCCCRLNHKVKKHTKPCNMFNKIAIINSMEKEHDEGSEFLNSGLSISDRTSFIPPKSWYSLGSLCDEDENCESCGANFHHHGDHNHHRLSDDSDNKHNSSTNDVFSYNDTGYTSTEEDDSITTSADSKDGLSCDRNSSPENGSYDGDYESDDDIFRCRLVASDDMVYKPLPSISEPFAIDAYAMREWSSNTATAKDIREGYAAIPNHVSCHQIRQIRGDNYCAIRAALFQALLNGGPILAKLPEEGVSQIIQKLLSSTRNAVKEWSFAGRITVVNSEVLSTLEEILTFFIDEVHKCEEISSKQAKTDHLLSLFNEESGNSEFRLLEAVKLLMLFHAIQLYEDINCGKVVPILAWLLFARESSKDPQGFLRNHLNSVGDSGGLEQVEMCLLGYTLGVVIQVFRPSQVTKQDFIANYPYLEDVPPLTPTVSLVAEDDRHYNIVVE